MREIGVTIKKRIPCMNNSVEVLTPFSEGNQGLLKLHVHFGWGIPVWGKWAVLCCIASGKSSLSSFSLRQFDVWCLMLKRDAIERTLVA